MIITCENCGIEFVTAPCFYKRVKRHFCSRKCFHIADKTRSREQILKAGTKTRFQPGHKPSKNRKMQKGTSHYAWKGENVGYRGLHYWLIRVKGKATVCVKCGKEGRIQWANIDGEYHRIPEDYVGMCASCHKYHDLAIKATRGAPPAIEQC